MRIAGLVVVPGIDLHLGAVDDHRRGRVHDRGARVVGVVGRDQRPGLVAEDALERAGGGGLEEGVDLFGGGRALDLEDAVGERGVQQRHPHRVAVQAARQFGIDQRDRGGAAGRRRDQAVQRRARAAQVLGGPVDDGLRVGHVMDRGDRPVPDAEALVDHLHHRGEAVGGAGGRRDDPVPGGVIGALVHAEDDVRGGAVLDRGRDHDAFDACREIGRERGLGLEDAGAVDDHVDAVERQLAQVLRADERQPRAVDGDAARVMGELGVPAPVDGVELEQVRVHLRVAHRVVDPGDLCTALQQRLQGELADAAEPVQRVDGHAGVSVPAGVRPMSSTARCSDSRSRLSKGSAVKARMRFRSAP